MKRVIAVVLLLFIGCNVLAIKSPTMSPGSLEINGVLKRGDSAILPAITVLNKNDSEMKIEMSSISINGQNGMEVPKEWVELSHYNFSLGSGESQRVIVKFVIPKNAKFGEYETFIKAKGAFGDSINETSLVPSVATKIHFEVEGTLTLVDRVNGSLAYIKINTIDRILKYISWQGILVIGSIVILLTGIKKSVKHFRGRKNKIN